MKTRVGPVRALLATIGTLALVLPVGTSEGGVARAISIPEAMVDLAGGKLGVGVLYAFGAGLEGAALIRLGIVAAAWIAFVLLRVLSAERGVQVRPERRNTTCPSCGFRTAGSPAHCPSCGAAMRGV